ILMSTMRLSCDLARPHPNQRGTAGRRPQRRQGRPDRTRRAPPGPARRGGLTLRGPGAINRKAPPRPGGRILRHFTGLSNEEAAQVREIKSSAAVNRYVRALKRLKDVFQGMPGGIEGI